MNTGSRPSATATEPCGATRAQLLISSGMVDVAAEITSLASSLTDSAIRSIQTRISERGREVSMDEVDLLRVAIFHGIAQNIIEKVEERLKAELERCRSNTSGSLLGDCNRREAGNAFME